MSTKSPAFRDLGTAVALFSAGLVGCDRNDGPVMSLAEAPVSDSVAAQLAGMRIFFGHQSVGGNIVAGVEALSAGGLRLPIAVVRTQALDSAQGAVLAHEWIGENGDPVGKMMAYQQILSSGPAQTATAALMKLCYSDFSKQTNPESLFAQYVATVEAIHQAQPGIVLAHVTTPVVTEDGMAKYVLRMLRGRLTNRDRNQLIQRYNQLMRAKYAPTGRLFDLAAIESGASTSSNQTPNLLPAYSDDGEHLNAAGQRVVAAALLGFLGSLRSAQ